LQQAAQAGRSRAEKDMGIENPVHLLFVALVALLVLGPKRLPKLARAVGQGIREFRGALEQAASQPAESTMQPPETPPAPAQVPAPVQVPPAQAQVPPAQAQVSPQPTPAQPPTGQAEPPAGEPAP
jgi:TatA/E family protein of Tat protein translocase